MKIRTLAWLAVALVAGPITANAVVVDSSDWVRISFDFTGRTPPPPYHNVNVQLFTALSNDLNTGEGFTLQAFDHNAQAVSNPISVLMLSNAGGGIETGFGGPVGEFFGTLTQPTGFLLMTGIIGSFDLTGAWVEAANLNSGPVGTGWIGASIGVVPAPEPGTLALLGFGLLGLGLTRRKT